MSNIEGVNAYIHDSPDEIISENLINFIKWGLLEIGAYYNLAYASSGIYGQSASRLNPLVSSGTAYQYYYGQKSDWIWETGVVLKATGLVAPIQASGIYVNGVFTTTGHTIDYSRGRVILDRAHPSGTIIHCPHSMRHVSVYSRNSQEARDLESNWMRPLGSGTSSLTPKVYLPAIIVGITDERTLGGYQLGTRERREEVSLELDVLGNNAWDVNKLSSLLKNLETKSIQLYNTNTAPKPLTYSGSLRVEALGYPALASGWAWGAPARGMENGHIAKFHNSRLQLYHNKVRIGLEVVIQPI